jgi:hypothetical protein
VITFRNIPFGEIDIDRGLIYGGMGFGGNTPDGDMCRRVEETIAEISAVARPCYTCNVVEAGLVERGSVMAGGVRFTTGNVIAPFFAGSVKIAVFVATTGIEFGQWLHGVKLKGDILEEFVADAIGSAFAEAVVARMALDMEREQEALGNHTGNSYSPGYCGWSVEDQRRLFSLLPSSPCGVVLSDSCLMVPVKSVSGLIPVGPFTQKHPYGCDICGKKGCFKKKLSKTP